VPSVVQRHEISGKPFVGSLAFGRLGRGGSRSRGEGTLLVLAALVAFYLHTSGGDGRGTQCQQAGNVALVRFQQLLGEPCRKCARRHERRRAASAVKWIVTE